MKKTIGTLVRNNTSQALIQSTNHVFHYIYSLLGCWYVQCFLSVDLFWGSKGGHRLWITTNSPCPALHGAHTEKMHKVKQRATRRKCTKNWNLSSRLRVPHRSYIVLWGYRVAFTAVHEQFHCSTSPNIVSKHICFRQPYTESLQCLHFGVSGIKRRTVNFWAFWEDQKLNARDANRTTLTR